MIQRGFQGSESKGLFTFYRQQDEIELKNRRDKMRTLQEEVDMPSTERYTNRQQATAKKVAVSQCSVYQHQITRKAANSSRIANNQVPKAKDRDCKVQKQNPSIQTAQTIVSLNFNLPTTRKNAQQFKLPCRPKRSKTEMQKRHRAVQSQNEKYSSSFLPQKVLPVLDIFTPKRTMKNKSSNRNELRLNSIVGRCINPSQLSPKEAGSPQTETPADRHWQQVHPMPKIYKCSSGKAQQQKKNNCFFSSMSFRNKAEERANRMKECVLWRDNYRLNAKAEAVNANQRIEEWVCAEIVTKDQSPVIHKTPFPFYFHKLKRCS